MLVQVVKDPIGTKGARLSTQVSIAGRLLVYLPQDPHIGISQRIEDEAGRQALREKLQELVPADEKGGFIVRTLAESASEEELRADIEYLRNLWRDIRERSLGARAAAAALPGPVARAARAARHGDRRQIDRGAGRFAREPSRSSPPSPRPTCRGCAAGSSTTPASGRCSTLYNVEPEIEKALSRRVDLKSGGTLVIDQTEAMTTIDVNTGGFVGSRNFDDTVFKTNLEAAQAIARQLRLRNLGGIIIVDFIDMESEEHRAAVLEELRRALARDRTRMTVNGFTALGLVEMTRKRTRESLAHVLCEPCPPAAAAAQVKTARTVCYEILREILREARAFKASEFRVLGVAGGDRPVPGGGVGLAGDALGFHRQADLAAGRDGLFARSSSTSC